MLNKLKSFEDMISSRLGTNIEIEEAFLVKVGFVKFNYKDQTSSEDFFSSDNTPKRKAIFEQHIRKIYAALNDSPNVMEITPTIDEFKSEKYTPLFFKVWADETFNFLSFDKFIKIRIALPKKNQDELYSSPFSFDQCPETFNIFFNGAIFVAITPIEYFPFHSHIGQISREFLGMTLGEDEDWERSEGYGPTPIHPDFYFVKLSANDQISIERPLIFDYKKRDVISIIPNELESEDFINGFIFTSLEPIQEFYNHVITRTSLIHAVDLNLMEDQELRRMMSEYFARQSFSRFIGVTSTKIRKILSEMHLTLLEISSLQIQKEDGAAKTMKAVESSIFLSPVKNYFWEHTQPEQVFDRNAQLTTMNFAANEVNNNSINRATLVAAFVGGVIGGLISLLVSIF